VTDERRRLQDFWEQRYRRFSLTESGIINLSPLYNDLYYECKRQAYVKALNLAGVLHRANVRLLDAGAGQGYFPQLVSDLLDSPIYVGVDISDRVITHLRTLFPAYNWHRADFTERIPEDDESFDLVQSIEVLHLIVCDQAYQRGIAELARVLRRGGNAIVTEVLPPSRFAPNDYICFRDRSAVSAILERAGFRIVAEFPMYYFLPDRGPQIPLMRWVCRRLPPRLIYLTDRLALRLRLPQLPQKHDSRMKMLVLHNTTGAR
jgi:SAM-dependent methyltransferase